jgi:hypothetical protein
MKDAFVRFKRLVPLWPISTAPDNLTHYGRRSHANQVLLSGKGAHFTESVIREMTRKAMLYDAVNLAQGFPKSRAGFFRNA